MAHNLDGKLTEIVVFLVGESLRRSHHDTLAGVDSERVEILHVADSDTVVITVPYHLVLNLFPTFEGFFHKDLRREREGLLAGGLEFLLVVAEA